MQCFVSAQRLSYNDQAMTTSYPNFGLYSPLKAPFSALEGARRRSVIRQQPWEYSHVAPEPSVWGPSTTEWVLTSHSTHSHVPQLSKANTWLPSQLDIRVYRKCSPHYPMILGSTFAHSPKMGCVTSHHGLSGTLHQRIHSTWPSL
jgi:hypothetical protein